MFSVLGFELDGHLEIGLRVDSLEDFPEGPLIELLDYLVVLAHFLRDLRHWIRNIMNIQLPHFCLFESDFIMSLEASSFEP